MKLPLKYSGALRKTLPLFLYLSEKIQKVAIHVTLRCQRRNESPVTLPLKKPDQAQLGQEGETV